jgi:nucleotide-binding universal stress UspA family protein
MAGEIVVGYNGTDGAKRALQVAIELCKDLNATLVVAFGYGVARMAEARDHELALKELGERDTAEGVEMAKAAGVSAEAALVDAKPAEALAQLAAERGARLVATGSYGAGTIAGALLGTVPHKLLHLSTVPVLVVTRGD